MRRASSSLTPTATACGRAEARTKTEVARVMIRVGGPGAPQQQERSHLPPYVVIGGLILLIVLAWWYLLLRRRSQRRRP